jgi:DNA uptake protein ComE-like DNA-binding protein
MSANDDPTEPEEETASEEEPEAAPAAAESPADDGGSSRWVIAETAEEPAGEAQAPAPEEAEDDDPKTAAERWSPPAASETSDPEAVVAPVGATEAAPPEPASAEPSAAATEAQERRPLFRPRTERKRRRQGDEQSAQLSATEARIAQTEARLDELDRIRAGIQAQIDETLLEAARATDQVRMTAERAVQTVAEGTAADARAHFSSLTNRLQQEASQRFEDLDKLAGTGRSIAEEVSSTRTELTATEGRVRGLEASLGQTDLRITELGRRLEAAIDARDRATAEQLRTALRAERESARDTAVRLMAPLEERIERLDDGIRAQSEALAPILTRLDHAESMLRSHEERVQLVFAERTRALKPIEENMTKLDAGQASLNGLIDELIRTIESLEGQIQAALGGVESLEQGLRSLENKNAERQSALSAGLSRATEAISGLQSAVAEISEAQAAIEGATGPRSAWIPDPPQEVDEGERVDVNTASFEELRQVGLSVTQAARLLAMRDAAGRLGSVDDLDALPGLPEDLLAAIKGRIRV